MFFHFLFMNFDPFVLQLFFKFARLPAGVNICKNEQR